MKKLFLILFLVSFALVPNFSLAQQACPGGTDGECDDLGGVTYECDTSTLTCVAADTGAGSGSVQTGQYCSIDGDCSGNLACINHTCQIDPSLEDPGTAGAGGACGQPDANGVPVQCPGGQTCQNNVCVGATGNSTTAGGGGSGGTSFVPLAPIPGLDSTIAPDANGIATFLNNLYIYLIGIAAVLAIIEIIWGGLEIATKDSVSKNRDGKNRIWQALLGLALVLLPVLVFTIINPSILQLNINMPALKQYTSGINVTTGTPVGNGTQEDLGGTIITPPSTEITHQIMLCPAGPGGKGQDCTSTDKQCSSLTTTSIFNAQLWVGTYQCVDATTHTYLNTVEPLGSPTATCPSGQILVVDCKMGKSISAQTNE